MKGRECDRKVSWHKGLGGYLTVFLTLSLTIFLGVYLGLLKGALQNLGKMRFECAADIGMNSLLGEFHKELLAQYDLLFVDISYGSQEGKTETVEAHLKEYMEKNLEEPNQKAGTWNELEIKEVTVAECVLASDCEGMIMRHQAGAYMKESGKKDAFAELQEVLPAVRGLDGREGMELWSNVMSRISAIPLPRILKEQGEWEEVRLDNPAEPVFDSAGEQIQNVCCLGKKGMGGVIEADSYLSHRSRERGSGRETESKEGDEGNLFQSYLFEKCGNYQKEKPGALLKYQIEYIIFGENSDKANLSAAAERIFQWKFIDHIDFYFNNEGKYAEAEAIAQSLHGVKLKPELLEPVTESILYAWAFAESINDAHTVMEGGRIPLRRTTEGFAETGMNYEQYLWLMLSCNKEETVNLRAMDIMEMDIRQTAYNESFRMDWCLESYRARVTAADQWGGTYGIDRRYGYY